MRQLVVEPKEEIRDWILSKMDYPCWIEDYQFVFGLEEDGQMIGGAILHDRRPIPNGIEMQMTIAGEKGKYWLTPKVIRGTMRMVFLSFNATSLIVACHSQNLASKKIIEKFGFKQWGCFPERMGGPGEDCLVYGLLKKDCKWL